MSRSPEHPSRRPRVPGAPSSLAATSATSAALLALRAEDFTPRHEKASDLAARMGAWAGPIIERLAETDVGVEAVVTGEGESTAVAFIAAGQPSEGAPARLVLRVDGAGVRAGLELPRAGARAARARMTDPARALELGTALQGLPEQFTLGIAGAAVSSEAARATADDLRALLDRVERAAPSDAAETVWIGWSLPRAVAVEHAALLDEQLADAVVALAQAFALLGGDGSADARGADSRGRSRDRRGAKKGEDGRPDDDRDGQRTRSRARNRSRERDHEGPVSVEGEPEREPEASCELLSPRRAPFPLRRVDTRPSLGAAFLRRRPSKVKAVERGARVRVLKGPFAGKVGVVQELDGQGGARVMLGLLAVRLEVTHLMVETEGRGRPLLSSSHRKPTPARS